MKKTYTNSPPRGSIQQKRGSHEPPMQGGNLGNPYSPPFELLHRHLGVVGPSFITQRTGLSAHFLLLMKQGWGHSLHFEV